MICPKCKHILPDDGSLFCVACGARLKTEESNVTVDFGHGEPPSDGRKYHNTAQPYVQSDNTPGSVAAKSHASNLLPLIISIVSLLAVVAVLIVLLITGADRSAPLADQAQSGGDGIIANTDDKTALSSHSDIESVYSDAAADMAAGDYAAAIYAFKKLEDYKDSKSRLMDCYYLFGTELYESGAFAEALTYFRLAPDRFPAPSFSNYSHSSAIMNGEGHDFDSFRAFDNLLDTCWQENAPGDGVGEWIMCGSGSVQKVFNIGIYNGFCRNRDMYYSNGRVTRLKIETDSGYSDIVELNESYTTATLIYFDDAIFCKWIKLTVVEADSGSVWQDTAISEVYFN